MIPLLQGTKGSQIHRNKKHSSGCHGLENGELVFNGYQVPVREHEKILEMDGVMVTITTYMIFNGTKPHTKT